MTGTPQIIICLAGRLRASWSCYQIKKRSHEGGLKTSEEECSKRDNSNGKKYRAKEALPLSKRRQQVLAGQMALIWVDLFIETMKHL